MAKLKHLEWDRLFDQPHRIEAFPVHSHPDYPPHDHDFMEVVVIVDGSCIQQSALGEQRIGAGSVSLFRPGAWHAYKQVESLLVYNCCFDPVLLGSELGWMVNDPLLSRLLWSEPLSPPRHGMVVLQLNKLNLARVKNILEEMGDTRQREVTAHFSEHLGLLMQFLGILSHHLPRETSPTPRNKIHPAVTSAIKLIDETPAETWTLQLLAEKLGLHPNYLCRRFREIVGLSPMNYLTRRRLEMATSLLRRTPLPVGEVGAAVGWSDANYFTRRFQDKFGLSPSKYRTRFTHERKQSNDTPFAASLETEIRRKRK